MRTTVRLALVLGAVITAVLSMHPSQEVVCLTVIITLLYVISEYVMYRISEKPT